MPWVPCGDGPCDAATSSPGGAWPWASSGPALWDPRQHRPARAAAGSARTRRREGKAPRTQRPGEDEARSAAGPSARSGRSGVAEPGAASATPRGRGRGGERADAAASGSDEASPHATLRTTASRQSCARGEENASSCPRRRRRDGPPTRKSGLMGEKGQASAMRRQTTPSLPPQLGPPHQQPRPHRRSHLPQRPRRSPCRADPRRGTGGRSSPRTDRG